MPSIEPARFPLGDFLDLELIVPTEGRALARIDLDDHHLNPNGTVHGAVLFAMVDTAMGAAVLSVLDPDARCASTDVHLRFLRPATTGRLEATVEVDHRGRRSVTLSGRVTDGQGQLLATATGAFAVLAPQA